MFKFKQLIVLLTLCMNLKSSDGHQADLECFDMYLTMAKKDISSVPKDAMWDVYRTAARADIIFGASYLNALEIYDKRHKPTSDGEWGLVEWAKYHNDNARKRGITQIREYQKSPRK